MSSYFACVSKSPFELTNESLSNTPESLSVHVSNFDQSKDAEPGSDGGLLDGKNNSTVSQMGKSVMKNSSTKIDKESVLPRFLTKKSVEIYMKDAYGINFHSLIQTELKHLMVTLFKAFSGDVTHRNRSFEMLEISFMVTDDFKILLNSVKPIRPIKRAYWINRMYEDSLRGLFELLRQSEIEDMSYFFELIGIKERSDRLR